MAPLTVALLAAAAPPAQAQGQDEAGARALFNDGRKLERNGRYDEACSKFEAARQLFPSAGVLLNLADCHEHIGRTASAWTEFGDTESAAASAGRTIDQAEAKRRQAALEPRLLRLAIRVVSPLPEEVVRRDGLAVDRGAWKEPIPVDPGAHAVTAEAPGRVSWSKSIEVKDPGSTVTVEVPPLAPPTRTSAGASHSTAPVAAGETPQDEARTQAPPLATRPVESADGDGRRIAGLVVGGAGIGAMGAAGVLVLVAWSRYESATRESGARQFDDSESAVHLGNAASIAVGAGAAATVAGAIVWLTAPRSPVAIGPVGASLVVRGTFR